MVIIEVPLSAATAVVAAIKLDCTWNLSMFDLCVTAYYRCFLSVLGLTTNCSFGWDLIDSPRLVGYC